MNRIFIDVITNIFGIFILLILYFIIEFSSKSIMTVEGVLLPLVKETAKDYYYLEVVKDKVFPVGLGGNCDESIYKKVQITSDKYACIIQKDIQQKNNYLYSAHNKQSAYKLLRTQLLPKNVYFVLLTRPSSFHIYHYVAKDIISEGYEVGWSPVDEESPLTFSPRGRKVGIQ